MRVIAVLFGSLALILFAFTVILLSHPNAMLKTIAAITGTGTPRYATAGVPFFVHDSYATQLCWSSHSGQILPPYVAPWSSTWINSSLKRPDVAAFVPFTVSDANGTYTCVSSRPGRSYPPFVAQAILP